MFGIHFSFGKKKQIKQPATSERGSRSTEEQKLRALYESMMPSFNSRQIIFDIRRMDATDGHVKRIHHRTSHALTKGLLTLENPKKNKRLAREWALFSKSLQLDKRAKLASDARGLMMEGNLPLQWVLNKEQSAVVRGIRMPTETINILTDESGQIANMGKAYAQYDFLTGQNITHFAYWQMDIARLDPLNFDDQGELGRPFLDSNRKVWKQMVMTLEDLVIRRRHRAPMRTAHVLEGASPADLDAYKQQVEADEEQITTNYYLNRKGGVDAVQGDANLDQVADISMLFDAFFAGTPYPKGLLGYADGLSRDVLEDMKKELYDELDVLQDLQSDTYELGFRLHLLLRGFNPDALEFKVKFAELLTESLNQRADRALKLQSLQGASQHTVLRTAGLDPNAEEELRADEDDLVNPYPSGTVPTKVSVTQNNAKKGESSTHVSNG